MEHPLVLWKSKKEMDEAFKKAYKDMEESYYNIKFQLNAAMMAEATRKPEKIKRYTRKKNKS